MICSKCQVENPENARYCVMCGYVWGEDTDFAEGIPESVHDFSPETPRLLGCTVIYGICAALVAIGTGIFTVLPRAVQAAEIGVGVAVLIGSLMLLRGLNAGRWLLLVVSAGVIIAMTAAWWGGVTTDARMVSLAALLLLLAGSPSLGTYCRQPR